MADSTPVLIPPRAVSPSRYAIFMKPTMKDQGNKEAEEIKNEITKQGDEIRKSLLDKLFSLNAILSAIFIVLYQLDQSSSHLKILNVLPFCTVGLILIYQYLELLTLGDVYYQIENWKKGDYESLVYSRKASFNVILVAIILTIIELGYLFYLLLS